MRQNINEVYKMQQKGRKGDINSNWERRQEKNDM